MQNSFKDSMGREWTFNITIGVVKAVRKYDVDLLALSEGEPSLISKLSTDVVLLCDVMYMVLKEQLDAKGVSDEQFAASLGGNVILSAADAFFRELSDFFQSLGRHEMVAIVKKNKELMDEGVKRVAARVEAINTQETLDKIDIKIDAEMRKKMDSIYGDTSTN
jgi:hypothetical protein